MMQEMILPSSGERGRFTKNRDSMLTYEKLTHLHANIFDWEGFPSYIDVDFIELTLMQDGMILLINTEYGIIPTRVTPINKINNMKPFAFDIIDNEMLLSFGIEKTRWNTLVDDCIAIFNNVTATSSVPFMLHITERLTEIESKAMQNVRAQSIPYLIDYTSGNEKMALEFHKEIQMGAEFIFMKSRRFATNIDGSDNTPLKENVLKLDKQFIAIQINDFRMEILNDFLSYLGINNANVNKRERMITDEVNSNNQLIDIYAANLHRQRERASKAINEKWGLGVELNRISVERSVPYDNTDNERNSGYAGPEEE